MRSTWPPDHPPLKSLGDRVPVGVAHRHEKGIRMALKSTQSELHTYTEKNFVWSRASTFHSLSIDLLVTSDLRPHCVTCVHRSCSLEDECHLTDFRSGPRPLSTRWLLHNYKSLHGPRLFMASVRYSNLVVSHRQRFCWLWYSRNQIMNRAVSSSSCMSP